MQVLNGYLGTYSSPQSAGIYRFQFHSDTGIITEPELYYTAPDSKYLSLYRGQLAAPIIKGEKAGVCLLDTAGTPPRLIGESLEETTSACYVIQNEEFLYTANYHEGSILIYRKTQNGLTLWKRLETGHEAGCHQILFHGSMMLVPCLLRDQILMFDMDRGYAEAGHIAFPSGTGPRHGVFDRAHKRFFLVSELSNELFLYETGHGSQFTLKSVQKILPEGRTWSPAAISAAVRLSPDEHFLYISTRYADFITVFQINGFEAEKIQQTDCGGSYPRDFIITGDGSFLLAVNRYKGGLVSFRLNKSTGRLDGLCSRVPAPEAVAVVLDETVPIHVIN